MQATVSKYRTDERVGSNENESIMIETCSGVVQSVDDKDEVLKGQRMEPQVGVWDNTYNKFN